MVGEPPADVEGRAAPPGVSTTVIWSPVLCERPDGSRYALHTYYQRHALGDWQRVELQGGVEHPDGRTEPFVGLVPDLEVRDDNRRVLGGTLHFQMADGTERPVQVDARSGTGFHLGAGLYFGFDGHWHGQWRGPLVVDGEHVADCSDPAAGASTAPDPRLRGGGPRPGGRRDRLGEPPEPAARPERRGSASPRPRRSCAAQPIRAISSRVYGTTGFSSGDGTG